MNNIKRKAELFIVLLWVCLAACGSEGHGQPHLKERLLELAVQPALTTGSSCDASPFMECANVGNIQYPFWGSPACAASSPTFVLSNCNSSGGLAVWDAFADAQHGRLGGDSSTSGIFNSPPFVIDLISNYEGSGTISIGLGWNMSSLNYDACAASVFSSKNLSHYRIIPPSIDLTSFANSSIRYATTYDGSYSTFLLFNCTNKASMSQLSSNAFLYELIEENTDCTAYKTKCNQFMKNTSCINFRPHKELQLQHVIDTLACSHFTFGATSISYSSMTITHWITGVVQLIWSNSECAQCTDAAGVCAYDPLSPAKLLYCECGNRRIRDFNTHFPPTTCYVCHGGLMQCKRILKICISVAVAGLAVMLALLALYFRRRIRKGLVHLSRKLAPIAIRVLKKTLMHVQAFSYRPSHAFNNMDLGGLTERPIEYSYAAIASATNCFSSVVGEGGFGMVYKGTLPASRQHASMPQGSSGIQIAVKVLEMRSRHSKAQYLNEVVTIGRIHHLNVVRLLGFCMQEDHEMLVYEYVVNRSLDKWLFGTSTTSGQDQEKPQVLNWGQRYAIALGIAKGLSYLHEECRHRTVHCDIKPQNILLDEEMCPKIADFGLARLMGREESQVVTIVKGTPGYMAPEFWMGGESKLSTKFDVYSYGMVLLEILSGRRNFVPGKRCFPAVAFEAAMRGDFESILDPSLGISSTNILSVSNASVDMKEEREGEALHDTSKLQWMHQIQTAVFVALWCIQDHPSSRPCMSEVVQYLEGVTDVSHNPPQPTVSNDIPPASVLSHPSSSTTGPQEFTPISVGR